MKILFLLGMLVVPNPDLNLSYFLTENDIGDCYTREGYVAAISEKYLDDLIRYSVDKDYVAIQKLLKAGVVVEMKQGVKVFVVKTHLLSGKVEFRIPGYTDILWTVTEGIKC
jgi:hypothetical protein